MLVSMVVVYGLGVFLLISAWTDRGSVLGWACGAALGGGLTSVSLFVQAKHGNGISFDPKRMQERAVKNARAGWFALALAPLGVVVAPLLSASAYAAIGAMLL